MLYPARFLSSGRRVAVGLVVVLVAASGVAACGSNKASGLPGVSRTVVDCVGQAALLLLTKSCSASLGVRYPSAE